MWNQTRLCLCNPCMAMGKLNIYSSKETLEKRISRESKACELIWSLIPIAFWQKQPLKHMRRRTRAKFWTFLQRKIKKKMDTPRFSCQWCCIRRVVKCNWILEQQCLSYLRSCIITSSINYVVPRLCFRLTMVSKLLSIVKFICLWSMNSRDWCYLWLLWMMMALYC